MNSQLLKSSIQDEAKESDDKEIENESVDGDALVDSDSILIIDDSQLKESDRIM